MEDYIAANYPGFFAADETQIPPAELKRLKSRCRQTARSLWYALGNDQPSPSDRPWRHVACPPFLTALDATWRALPI